MTRGLGGHSPANVTHHLKGTDFPASRADIEQQAQENGADDEILEVVRNMPDREYEDMADVLKGVGEAE
ncbi:DUF2795 domain-containing protein [Halomonas korlensis]|uniref:DUF2795 domain-containing protein n=1 Tax=Halomonas korlensis TaxID=463301 RepID=A0A1I7IAB8_9GAMM|nr:DUF2795 domain-containing protein [Halomonas korlensis]SFU69915.1 Protein of unknown function [Halomonas korlensis]